MGQATQNVVYRLDAAHDPAWQFYSMPESIVGGGQTLDAARSQYQAALRFSLETDVLPAVNEFIEREMGNTGIWLRMPVGQGDYDALLENGEARLEPGDYEWLRSHPTAGGDPVIVNAMPHWPVRRILEQMSDYDSLIIAMLHHSPEKVRMVFLAIAGAETANSEFGKPLIGFDAAGLTVDSPVSELMQQAMSLHVSGFSVPAMC